MTTDFASEMIRLADTASLVEPISSRFLVFDVREAYAVSREVLALREAAGWRRAGRKIGFTNRTIWDQYGVYEPIFGYMYDRTVTDALIPALSQRAMGKDLTPSVPLSVDGEGEGGEVVTATLSLDGLAQPLIEPEIVFRLRQAPPRTHDPEGLLDAVDWVGHGFEIVQCHFPGWKFKVADTIADGGLHGRYVLGPRFPVERGKERELARRLASFRLTLLKNGSPQAEGGGELVLGSPLNALAHLIDVLDSLPDHPPLEAGELVTTGTLTVALPIARGETWSTRIEGLELPGITLRVRRAGQ